MDILKMSKIENLNKVSKKILKNQDETIMLLNLFMSEKIGDDKIYIFSKEI